MLYYNNYYITLIEVPDEISLVFTITGCKLRCPDCHSKELWEESGHSLTYEVIDYLLDQQKYITCVAFLGGEHNIKYLNYIIDHLNKYKKDIKTCLYTGLDLDKLNYNMLNIDYLKVGKYIAERGGLDSINTNQRMYYHGEDITYKFWRK